AALILLTEGAAAAKPAEWTKLVDAFLAYTALEKGSPSPAELALNADEREQLGQLRSHVKENVETLLKAKTLPPDQSAALVAKLEQLGASAELEIYKVYTALGDKQFDQARQLLK